MIRTLLFACLVFTFTSKVCAQPCKTVVGYFPGWQWYDRAQLVNPQTIEYEKYSIINYAFFSPLEDGSLTIIDPWGDKNVLLGNINWATAPVGYDSSYDFGDPAYHIPGTGLVDLAHDEGTQVLISLGGWSDSDLFPGIAEDPVKRTNFAHWCNEAVRAFGFDGIDVDWEYPGYEPHGGSPADKANFTLLIQEVRDSLDALEPDEGHELLLTGAFGASPDRMDDVEWDDIVLLMDYINLMSYDYFGAWDANSNHNSPLYQPAVGDPDFNISTSVSHLVNTYDVPSDIINIGVAFYGRSVKTSGDPTLHGPTLQYADGSTFWEDEGSPLYYNIQKHIDQFSDHWDEVAGVPYLLGIEGLNTFVSYDNEASIELKAQFVLDNDLAGVIIWEITGDYMETFQGSGVIAGTPLTDALNYVFCNESIYCPADFDQSGTVNSTDLLIFLSEFGCLVDCTANLNGDENPQVDVSDLLIFLSYFGQSCD
jgi:chitinase